MGMYTNASFIRVFDKVINLKWMTIKLTSQIIFPITAEIIINAWLFHSALLAQSENPPTHIYPTYSSALHNKNGKK